MEEDSKNPNRISLGRVENGLSGLFGGRIVVQQVEGAKLKSCVGLSGKWFINIERMEG
jgi:hypothetical protein